LKVFDDHDVYKSSLTKLLFSHPHICFVAPTHLMPQYFLVQCKGEPTQGHHLHFRVDVAKKSHFLTPKDMSIQEEIKFAPSILFDTQEDIMEEEENYFGQFEQNCVTSAASCDTLLGICWNSSSDMPWIQMIFYPTPAYEHCKHLIDNEYYVDEPNLYDGHINRLDNIASENVQYVDVWGYWNKSGGDLRYNMGYPEMGMSHLKSKENFASSRPCSVYHKPVTRDEHRAWRHQYFPHNRELCTYCQTPESKEPLHPLLR